MNTSFVLLYARTRQVKDAIDAFQSRAFITSPVRKRLCRNTSSQFRVNVPGRAPIRIAWDPFQFVEEVPFPFFDTEQRLEAMVTKPMRPCFPNRVIVRFRR
jgi:hypothetical protein